MHKRIVITGMGVISSTGVGKRAFFEAIKNSAPGIKEISLFDRRGLRSKLAGEIPEFDPPGILGKKGLRNLDRTTLLALCASELALEDAGLPRPIDDGHADEFGVSLGSTLGSISSISNFDKTVLTDGLKGTNPAHFSNTVINSPASHISIRFNLKGFNSTISTGFSASLDAVFYAANMIEQYGYHTALAGGVEELCEQTYKAFYRLGSLSASRDPGAEEISCPYDERRNGFIFGEGGAMFVLEERAHAESRGARIFGELLGYGSCFDPIRRDLCNPRASGATKAIIRAITDAGIGSEEIDYVSGAGNSSVDCDVMETRAIKNVFGKKAAFIPVSSIKPIVGETFSASGAMNLACVLDVIANGSLPPTLNHVVADKRCDLDYVPDGPRKTDVRKALVNAFGPTGNNAVLVVGKG